MLRIGHKGADLIEPGNTLASFDAAVHHGVDMIELDVLPGRPPAGADGAAADASRFAAERLTGLDAALRSGSLRGARRSRGLLRSSFLRLLGGSRLDGNVVVAQVVCGFGNLADKIFEIVGDFGCRRCFLGRAAFGA